MTDIPVCSIDGCCKPAKTRNMCGAHYEKWRKNPSSKKGQANGALERWIRAHLNFDGDECLIWPFARMPIGYACAVTIDGIRTYAHRHICRLIHGDPPQPKLDTAHSCGNGHLGCVNPKHLSWKTRKGNMQDQIDHGRTQRGSKAYGATLTEDGVRHIRSMRGVMKQKELAAIYGVTREAISFIQTRRTWAWLK